MVLKNLQSFSKRQILTLLVISVADLCNAICISLQAPFYPKEAEAKGASSTEYGLVFGIFELVVFLISPFYGQHLNRIGPKLLFTGGIFTTGLFVILFGLLDQVKGRLPFIVLSFLLRIVEAMGSAAFVTASFAIIAQEFREHVATTFASLETCFGLGLIVGPLVGGAMYEVGGFTTPFAVMGSCLFLAAVMAVFVLPKSETFGNDKIRKPSLSTVLKVAPVLLAAARIMVTSMSIGFLSATLEPHLRQFKLSAVIIGLVFIINGGAYALTAPVWGWLCDTKIHPRYASLIGCVLITFGFSLIGPASFLPFTTVLWVTALGLLFHGLGIAALLVSSFVDALKSATDQGLPNNLDTYGLISSLWSSTFALGAFLGPSLAGVLNHEWGFRKASLLIVILTVLIGVAVIVFLIPSVQRRFHNVSEKRDRFGEQNIAD